MILYEGPSVLDGAPIVVLASAGSSNEKTGPMIQTWIMRRDVAPQVAQATGDDRSVCGDCLQRPAVGGACYVVTFQGPLSVWKSYHRGTLQVDGAARVARAIKAGTPIRIGSYGDPAAVPVAVWQRLLHISRRYGAAAHTGYSHQWRLPVAQALRWFVMASCDGPDDVAAARALGWRTFTIVKPGGPRPDGSIECLSDAKGKTCAECAICDGARRRDTTSKQPASVWIEAHGFRTGRRSKRSAALAVI